MKYALQQTKVDLLNWRLIGHEKRLVLNSFKIIIGFYFTITILSSKGRHFLCFLLAKYYQMDTKNIKSKKSLQESTSWASECHSSHHSYNLLLCMRAIHVLKTIKKLWHFLLAKTSLNCCDADRSKWEMRSYQDSQRVVIPSNLEGKKLYLRLDDWAKYYYWMQRPLVSWKQLKWRKKLAHQQTFACHHLPWLSTRVCLGNHVFSLERKCDVTVGNCRKYCRNRRNPSPYMAPGKI